MAPAAEQITARNPAILLNNHRPDRGLCRDGNAFSDCAVVKISLQRYLIEVFQIPVHPEAALSHLPVIKVPAIWMELGTSREGFAIHTVVKVRAVSGSIPEIEETLLVSPAGGNQPTVGVSRVLGNDIDHAVDGVRSPDRSARTTDDLDPLHILHQRVLHLPINAGV